MKDITPIGRAIPTLPPVIQKKEDSRTVEDQINIEDIVVISGSDSANHSGASDVSSRESIILRKEVIDITQEEIEFCAEQLLNHHIKSGQKNKILELLNNFNKLSKQTILYICQYINNIPKVNDRLINSYIGILSILMSARNYQEIPAVQASINELTTKLSEKLLSSSRFISSEDKEKISNILLEAAKSFEVPKRQIIPQIVDYYKTIFSALKEQGKESIWQVRLENILDIAKENILISYEEDNRSDWKKIVLDIFETTENSRILEKILKNFSGLIENVSLASIAKNMELEISRVEKEVEYEKTQEYNGRRLKEIQQKLNLINAQLERSPFSFIRNAGGGDCAVYSIRSVLGIRNNISEIRKDICNIVEQFGKLSQCIPLRGQQLNIKAVKEAYSAIFADDFQLFKNVIIRYYENSLRNDDNNAETIRGLSENKKSIRTYNDWDDINNWDHIFKTVNTFDISYDLIIEDHKGRNSRVVIENYTQYKDYASRGGVWLNNHEINAFLLSKGYVFKNSIVLKGTVLVYENVRTGESVFLHNNAVDVGDNNAAGVHWQGLQLISDDALEEYERLGVQHHELSEEIREITKKISTSSKSNKFKLLENFIIALSLRSKTDLSEVFAEESVLDKILLVSRLGDNEEVLVASLKIANKLEKGDLENYYINKIILKCDKQEMILEALGHQSNLQFTEHINEFLLNQLINNDKDKSRELAISLLTISQEQAIKQKWDLQETPEEKEVYEEKKGNGLDREKRANLIRKHRIQADVIREILNIEYWIKENQNITGLYRTVVQRGERLPYNAFKSMMDNVYDQEVQDVIKLIVDKELQTIPQFIVDQYKELSKTEVTDVIISLFEKNYLKLEELASLNKLVDSVNTRGKVLELLETCVLKGLKLNESIKEKLEEISGESSADGNLIRNILKLEKGEKNAVDKLKDHRVSFEDKINLLEQIKTSPEYHTPYTIEFLLSLAEYEIVLREPLIDVITNILPNDYTQKGYDSNLLNKIIAFSNVLDIAHVANLVNRDRGANLEDTLKLVQHNIITTTEYNDTALVLLDTIREALAVNIEKEVGKVVLLKNIYSSLLDFCIETVALHPSKEVRNELLNIIGKFSKEELLRVKLNENLINYTLKLKDKDELDKLWSSIKNETYLPTDEQISKLIDNLSTPHLKDLSAEMLIFTLQARNLSTDILEYFYSSIKQHPDLLENKNVFNIICGYNKEDIIGLVESKIGDSTIPVELQEQAIYLLASGKGKYQEVVLNKMAACMLSTRNREAELQIAKYFVAQIEESNCSKLPTEVISALRVVAQEEKTFRRYEIQQLCLKGLNSFYLCRDENPYKFIKNCASKLHKHLTKQLESDYNKACKVLEGEKLSELSADYQKSKVGLIRFHNFFSNRDQDNINGLYKQLHSLCNAINLSLKHTGTLDLKVFERCNSIDWTEEILVKTLFGCLNKGETSSSKYSELTFIKRLKDLELTYDNRSGTIETFDTRWKASVLEELLNKQEIFSFKLHDINDLMGYVVTSPNALNILKKDNFWNESISSWIQNKLSNIKEIREQHQGLDIIIQKLASLITLYSYEILDDYFTKINVEENSLDELTKLFSMLRDSNLNKDSREIFLTRLDSSSAKDAETLLYEAISSSILSIRVKNDNSDYQFELPKGVTYNPSIKILDKNLFSKVAKNIATLLSNGWHKDSLSLLISKLKDEESLKEMNQTLITISDYALREYDTNTRGEKLIDVLKSYDIASCKQKVHELAIFSTFNISKEKDIEELAQELASLNPTEGYTSKRNIIREYEEINTRYRTITNLQEVRLSTWGSDEILEWSNKVKNGEITADIYEKLAVIKRAVEVSSKERGKEISPRPIQLMSALVLLNGVDTKGRLAEINTGEGKTTIVAMLAAYKALEGHQVDVITTSSELAKPQSEQQKLFFKKFDLTVSHNGKDDNIEIKERYKANIVYGAAGDFQGDILRDEYNKLGTRSGRRCDVAIVDEVDSMLIDGKNHMVMLSSPMPAMDYLEPILCTIWQQIDNCANSIEERDGKVYYVQKSAVIGDDGKMIQNEEILCPIESTKEEFIKQTTEKYIRKLLRDVDDQEFLDEELFEQQKLEVERRGTRKAELQIKNEVIDKVKKSFPELVIPKHLRDFVLKAQLPKWVESAIHAKYRSEINKHYILKDGNKIAPVDASNTGVVQANMNWSNGLHQFLQIKHGCKITPESITTNFISNVTFFQRYIKKDEDGQIIRNDLYGLTGTLGSKKSKELLHETYEVDSVTIPTFKQKQHKELSPIIKGDKEDWYNNIIESNLNKLENGRGVLIITKYIEEIDEIKKRLIARGYDESKIKLYRTEQDSSVVEQELKSGEIVIATNIAGRGTDIIPSVNVEKNGGLHVCVTFMPPNERLEQQNIGRTSRTGNKGTSQLIILDKEHTNIDVIKLIRNVKEEVSLEKAKSEIAKVTTKDRVFEKFCELLDEIDIDRGEKSVLTTQDVLKTHNRKAIEEQFGLWLKIKDQVLEKVDKERAIELFNNFAEKMRTLWSKLNNNDSAQVNPIFYILKGNVLLQEQKYEEAILEFNKAIELEGHFAANAYYNRGYARIAAYGNASQEKYDNEIREAKADFSKARQIIEENLEPMLHIIQRSLFANGGEEDSPVLSEQVQHKLYLYSMQKNAINAAIGIGETQYNKQIEELQAKLDVVGDKALKGKDRESVEKHLKFLKDNKTEQIKGEIGKIQDKNRGMEIEFNDIYKSFPEDEDVNLYKDEIEEYKNNGFQGTFKITEIVPVDWWSVIGVALIGLGQLVGGAALAVFTLGAGASIGMGMMSEGVSDLITAVKDGIINRDFSWAQWGIQKAISMAVSLVCAGMGAIKDAAKTVVAGVKATASAVKEGVTQTVKEGWKLAAKSMGIAIAKGVAKETVNTLVDYGIQQLAMPAIEENLTKSVAPKIEEALLANPNVEKMLKIDSKNRNKYYQKQIKNIAMELIHNKDSGIGKQILGYTRQFAEGIVAGKAGASQNKYARIFAHVGTVAGMAEAIAELVKFVPEFTAELDRKINELATKDGLDKNVESKEAEEEVIQQEKQESNTAYTTHQTFDASHSIEDRIGKKTTSQQKASQEAVSYNQEEIVSSLSCSVANNMGNTIKGGIFKPITNTAVSLGVDALSKGIDKAQQEAIGNFQAERRVQFAQDGNKHRLPKKMQDIANDPEAQSKAQSITQDLSEGGEAGLAHMGAISDEVGKPIKIFDEKGKLVKVIGEEKGGKAIEVRYEKQNGHYTLNEKGADGKYKQAPISGNNNCLFDVVAAQVPKDVCKGGASLRQNVVQQLSTPEGQRKLASVAHDISRLEQVKTDALSMGGGRKKNKLTTSQRNAVKAKMFAPLASSYDRHMDRRMSETQQVADIIVRAATNGNPLVKVTSANNQWLKGNASINTAAAHTVGVGLHFKLQTPPLITALTGNTTMQNASVNSWGVERVVDKRQTKFYKDLIQASSIKLYRQDPTQYLATHFQTPLQSDITDHLKKPEVQNNSDYKSHANIAQQKAQSFDYTKTQKWDD